MKLTIQRRAFGIKVVATYRGGLFVGTCRYSDNLARYLTDAQSVLLATN